ncbi:MAG: hypothetical protein A3H24_06385 [Rhodoferax sp. RIFCSPLOWO2_12_FULL_60_11]|jgi:hypothetical protein|nr:MAG: hypothetical protein A3H24_06385 [Rhodoferax sp. RIFCSPLOWO2_12_FULL_60_11]
MLKKAAPVMNQSPGSVSEENYDLAAQAPHLALQAPHFCRLLLAPHLLPVQARHIMEQPLSAAVVTTAMARAFVRVDDSEFILMLLRVMGKRAAYCLTPAQPPLLAPHLAFIFLALAFAACALLAAHWGWAAPHLALQAPHLAMLVLGPHFAPAQPAAMTLPDSAAAVTTAEAIVLAMVEERWFIKKSLEG